MSRPRGRPIKKNAVDRSDLEEASSLASNIINAELQGARALKFSPDINADYTLPGILVVSQRGAIPRDAERRRTLHEKSNVALSGPTNKERLGRVQKTSLQNKYHELKREYDNIRRENRELHSRCTQKRANKSDP